MTFGLYSPLPPARTGVADYSARLLAALRERGQIEANPPRADIGLYHLGNNQLHAEIYRRSLEQPGVVVLHDAVLHHFLLGFMTREQYIAEFAWNYGEWARDLAAELWQGRGRSAGDRRYFEYPMLRRVTETSRAVIVHNFGAAAMVRAHAPEARIHVIPHLLEESGPAPEADVQEFRSSLGIEPGEVLCGVFGYLRESKRIASVTDACGAAGLRLLVAGECHSDLQRALGDRLARPSVVRLGYAKYSDFQLQLHAADICINLRYPSAGETSGITIRAMGAGRPVIMTASAENAGYPEDCCVQIESGPGEVDHLTTVLRWLSEFPAMRREIGRRGGEYVRREHGEARVSELYWGVLRSL